jgi:DNA primase
VPRTRQGLSQRLTGLRCLQRSKVEYGPEERTKPTSRNRRLLTEGVQCSVAKCPAALLAWAGRAGRARRPNGEYLQQRGLCDSALIEELGLGYAPGGSLRSHLAHLGYSFDLLLRTGLITNQGRDAFCRRVIFPCRQNGRVSNLYGRSLGAAFPHRLLPRSKGGLYAWESVRTFPTVILVEGLFDLAVLWQVGFRNTTCAIGTHLTPAQLSQLADPAPRCVYIAFDQDANHAGQQASLLLAQLLKSRGLKVCIVALPAGQD